MGERPAPVPGVDPEFTDDDVEEILDYLAYEDSLCPGCGQPRVESFALANEDAYVGEVMACHSCTAKALAAKKFGPQAGIYTFVTKRDQEVIDG